MRKSIRLLMMAGAIVALSFAFTSCEDILGSLDKPIPKDTTFKKFNPDKGVWETVDLSTLNATSLTPAFIARNIADGTLNLTSGTYLVEGSVNIDVNVTVGGDGVFRLLLANGATCNIDGSLFLGDGTDLEVLSQEAAKMCVKSNDGTYPALSAQNMTIEGGDVEFKSTATSVPGGVMTGNITINSGNVKFMSETGDGVALGGNTIVWRGGDVTCKGKNGITVHDGLTVDMLELIGASSFSFESNGTGGKAFNSDSETGKVYITLPDDFDNDWRLIGDKGSGEQVQPLNPITNIIEIDGKQFAVLKLKHF